MDGYQAHWSEYFGLHTAETQMDSSLWLLEIERWICSISVVELKAEGEAMIHGFYAVLFAMW